MPISQHICYRCGHLFNRALHLERHLKKKNPCKFIELDTNGEIIQVNTDDIILQENNMKFDELETFPFKEKFEKDQTYSCLLVAIRRSGKTTLLKHLLYPLLIQDYDIVLFISNSIFNSCYDFVTGPRFSQHSSEMLKDILKFQRKTNMLFRIAVVFDDCVSIKKKNDDSLLQFFIRGRNSNIGIFLSTQSTTLVNKNNRSNSDFVFVGNNPSAEFREDVIKAFLNGLVKTPKFVKTKTQKFDYLNSYLLHHTKNHGFIVVDNINHKVYHCRLKLN